MVTNQKDKGKLSLFLAVVLGINAVVGAGVFLMPLNLVKVAGPAGILTVALATMCVLFIGLAFARLSVLLPQEGGFYTYASAWGGKAMGVFVSGIYLIGLIAALGLLVHSVSSVIAIYMTGVSLSYIGYFVIIGTIIATFFASSLAAVGQTILFILTLAPLFVIGYLCAKQGKISHFQPFFTHGWQGVLRGLPAVIFSFLGFESITSLSSLIKDPVKTIPLATLFTIALSGILYVSFVGCVLLGVPTELLSQKQVLSEVLLYAMPSSTWLVHCINSAIIITIIGTIYAITWSLSGLLIACVKRATQEKYRISETAALLLMGTGMLMSMKLLAGAKNAFAAIAFCIVLAYALSVFYLVIKPARSSDWLVGVAALISSLIIFISAFSQLI